MNPFFSDTSNDELIPIPMSRSKMLSLGLVPKTETHMAMDSAPTLTISQRRQELLAQKPAVMRSRDAKRIRAWNAAGKEVSASAMMFDAAPANPFEDMEKSIAAARERLRIEPPTRRTAGY